METHVINLIKTDIHLSRITEQLKQIGIYTDVISTNHLAVILFILSVKQTDELTDVYYRSIENGNRQSPELDNELAIKVLNSMLSVGLKK